MVSQCRIINLEKTCDISRRLKRKEGFGKTGGAGLKMKLHSSIETSWDGERFDLIAQGPMTYDLGQGFSNVCQLPSTRNTNLG